MIQFIISALDFKQIVEVIAALVTECRLHVKPDGVSVAAVDTANVAMVQLEVPTKSFVKFEVEKEVEIGLDVTKLHNALALVGIDDTLTLEWERLPGKEDLGTLDIWFGHHRFTTKTLDVVTIRPDPRPPTIELPARVLIHGNAISEAVKAACIVSERIRFAVGVEKANDHRLYIEAKGDNDVYRTDFVSEGWGGCLIKKFAAVKSCFSLDYMKDMAKVVAEEEAVYINLGEDHPISFEFFIGGLGTAKYLLAPRIPVDGEVACE